MPALPASFDYGECAAIGEFILAAWAESVFPDIGRAGLSIYRRG
jgi:hypothetical protein